MPELIRPAKYETNRGLWFVDPGGQGGFNIGVIERGVCRFSPAALFTLAVR